MKLWVVVAITSLVALQASAAAASCKPPDAPPTAPNGETASREEMLAAQAAMKSYNVAVAEYTQCVQKEGGSEIELNRIVNQLEKLAVRFNAELRKFKQRSGS
jgi:predicted outer membrane protein